MEYDSDIDDFHMDDDSEQDEIPIARYEILTTDEIVEQMKLAITEINSVIKVFINYKFYIQSRLLQYVYSSSHFQDSSDNNTYIVESFEMGQTGIIGKIDRQQL